MRRESGMMSPWYRTASLRSHDERRHDVAKQRKRQAGRNRGACLRRPYSFAYATNAQLAYDPVALLSWALPNINLESPCMKAQAPGLVPRDGGQPGRVPPAVLANDGLPASPPLAVCCDRAARG